MLAGGCAARGRASMARTITPDPGTEPGKFRRDVIWNVASTGVLAVGGLLMMALIGGLHGDTGLGVFAQVWAPYVIFGQLAVGGVDRSLLQALSARALPRPERGALIWGAVLPAFVGSLLFAAAFYLARDAFAAWYGSPDVAAGVAAATPGLFFFGLNKVLLGAVNGLRRMRAFALYQSLRYLLMPLGVGVAWWSGRPAAEAAFLFTFAEGVLFAALAVEVLVQVALPSVACLRHVRAHVVFGLRSMAAGVLLELNSRVDVWMLGHFLGDALVGVYAVAVQIAEGVFQILIALQNNYNPVIAAHLAAGERAELDQVVRSGGRRALLSMGGVAVVATAGFPIALWILFPGGGFDGAWLPFGILMAGIALSAIRMPFFQTLLMAGHPGWHSLFMLSVVAINVVGNWLLIPSLGIEGAALGTALSFVGSVVLLRLFARPLTGLRM